MPAPPTLRERMLAAGAILPRWLTPRVVAESLHVHPSTVHRMVAKGVLRGERLNGPRSPLRILAEDYMRYVEAMRTRMRNREQGIG